MLGGSLTTSMLDHEPDGRDVKVRCRICNRAKPTDGAATGASSLVGEVTATLDDVVTALAPQTRKAIGHFDELVGPLLTDTRRRVQPLVESTQHTVADVIGDDLAPTARRLPHPVRTSSRCPWTRRRKAAPLSEVVTQPDETLNAASTKVAVTRKPARVVRKFVMVLGITAVIAGIAVAVRKVLGSRDDGWSPQPPMQPVRPTSRDEWGPSPFASEASSQRAATQSAGAPTVVEDEPVADEVETLIEQPAETVTEKAVTQATVRIDDGYGEGAYVGDQPPEGYVIKGNERSMKYHLPTNAGWQRTNADVWFNSPEAAEAAGFTRALR